MDLIQVELQTLNTKKLGRPAFFVEEIPSTQEYLKSNADHLKPGTLLWTDRQSQGKGRRGRTWLSLPGKQILASLLLQPNLSPQTLPLCTLALARSVILALRECLVTQVGLKWPNDIYVEGRKLGGILGELLPRKHDSDQDVVVLGLGLNMQGTLDQIPEEFRFQTTTLELHGYKISRESLLATILNHFERELDELSKGFVKPLMDALNQDWIYRNAKITLGFGEERIQGVAREIRFDGSLTLELPTGEQRIYRSGEVAHVQAWKRTAL